MVSKGTPAFGKKHKTSVIKCRRCGRRAYHIRTKRCAACGFGESKRIRSYAWQTRSVERQSRLL